MTVYVPSESVASVVLAIGSKVRGFKPSLGDGFLRAIKNQQHAFLQRRRKAVGLMSYDFTVCKNHFEVRIKSLGRLNS
jgi:hypothetical protein